jgi:uncharacterized membrane protein
VRLSLELRPAGGSVGVLLAKALRSAPEKLMQKALRSFKSLVETGEIPNIRHNPAARRGGQEHQEQ